MRGMAAPKVMMKAGENEWTAMIPFLRPHLLCNCEHRFVYIFRFDLSRH